MTRAQILPVRRRPSGTPVTVQTNKTTLDANIRKAFASALKNHGVKDSEDFSYCTNALYRGILGCSAREWLGKKKLQASANLRAHLSGEQMAAIVLAEAQAAAQINAENPNGTAECHAICKKIAEAIGKLCSKE